MALRSRRSNAGNRLQSLLAEQKPLDDADAELFAERDDDLDFDLEAEEERLRQRRLAREAEDSEDGAGSNGGSGSDDDDDDENESEHDDSNFSDTTDDSELERDEDPADAGEKELQTESRQQKKEKRVAERNKLFKIKVRPPQESAPKPKKKRVFVSADILLEKGRHSERKSALRNKHHLIEQMREAEQRRAQYVAPKRQKAPKLTQEQRLEEAKKTELRNLSSLNKFVELEEERKIQQRLAMISRRPKLTHFVRFHSSQLFEPPKPVEIVEDLDRNDDGIKTESAGPHEPQGVSSPSLSSPQPPPQGERRASAETGPSVKKEDAPESVSQPKEAEAVAGGSEEKPGIKSEPDTSPGPNNDAKNDDEGDVENNIKGGASNGDAKSDDSNGVKADISNEMKADTDIDVKADAKVEFKDEDFVEPNPIYGPENLRTYNFLTLHEFPDVHINKYSIRSIVLGSIASAPSLPPLKRMCPFSGSEAHYLDPKSGVAYKDLENNKLIKLAREDKLGWSKELGGVFTTGATPQRPARGVPEGFA